MIRGALRSSIARRAAATIVIGVASGLGGVALALLLRLVQHLAYGYDVDRLVGGASFLDGVREASDLRRGVVLVGCGFAAGLGWWALDRFAARRVEIAGALASDDPRLPVATTIAHVALQVVTVALGSPLGREVAPRELGATAAGWLAGRFDLALDERRVMLACGAGAGLAAVYNVPLAGAVFTLEVLLATTSWRATLPAITTSVIAALVARLGLGDAVQYVVPTTAVDASLVAWSIVAGPILGVAAQGFRLLTAASRASGDAVSWQRVVLCVLAFAGIGLIAGPFPEVLGNGRGAAQLGFDGEFTTGVAVVMLALKVLVVAAALRVGAHGGTLTPSVSCGALLGLSLGAAWSLAWPGPVAGAYALIGAAAFLSVSQAMPLTAVVLLFEFTRIGQDFVAPVLLAVAGATAAGRLTAIGWARRSR